ncbi:MAG: hypothetical protein ACKO38_20250 [Planctomycetota bacterium]
MQGQKKQTETNKPPFASIGDYPHDTPGGQCPPPRWEAAFSERLAGGVLFGRMAARAVGP